MFQLGYNMWSLQFKYGFNWWEPSFFFIFFLPEVGCIYLCLNDAQSQKEEKQK